MSNVPESLSPVEESGEAEDDTAPLSPKEEPPLTHLAGSAVAAAGENLDEVDPFSFKPAFTLCDKILIAFNAFWLFPIRLLFIVIPGVILGTIVCFTSTLCEPYDPDNPTPRAKWRRKYVNTMGPFLDRIFLIGFGFNWIRYKGRAASTKVAPITIVAPHSSLLDVFVSSLFGVPTFVARDDMRNLRIFGPVITKALRTIYVKRDDPDSKMKAAEEIQRRASSGGVWPKVLLFPEGTTTNKKMIISFKKGAFLPKLPVQPLLIKYGNRLETTTWGKSTWDQMVGLFYTMCQFHNPLELELLDVYHPSEAEKADPQLYSKNVQMVVSEKMGIPAGVQSLEDNYFMSQAEDLGLPFISGMVLYNKISREIGVRFKDIKALLQRFATIDANLDGWIDPEDMAAFLSVPNDACLRALFSTAEGASAEGLNFKQYLYAFAGRAKPFLKNESFMKAVFDFFDKDEDGVITMSDISRVLPISKFPQVRRRGRGRGRGRGVDVEEEESPLEEKTFDFDHFKRLLEANPEYLLLFHECQNAGISSPQPPPLPITTSSPTKQQVLIEVVVDE